MKSNKAQIATDKLLMYIIAIGVVIIIIGFLISLGITKKLDLIIPNFNYSSSDSGGMTNQIFYTAERCKPVKGVYSLVPVSDGAKWKLQGFVNGNWVDLEGGLPTEEQIILYNFKQALITGLDDYNSKAIYGPMSQDQIDIILSQIIIPHFSPYYAQSQPNIDFDKNIFYVIGLPDHPEDKTKQNLYGVSLNDKKFYYKTYIGEGIQNQVLWQNIENQLPTKAKWDMYTKKQEMMSLCTQQNGIQ